MSEEILSEKKYRELCVIHEHAINELMGPIRNMVDDLNNNSGRKVVQYFDSRIKDKESLEDKLQRKGCELSEIFDIGGIKIVVIFGDDIPIVSDMIDNLFHVKETKDYIKKPKDSGYRSVHKIVTVKPTVNGRVMQATVEIQIKTVLKDALWSMEHVVRYKRDEDDYDPDVTEIVSNAADDLESLEQRMIIARDFKQQNS